MQAVHFLWLVVRGQQIWTVNASEFQCFILLILLVVSWQSWPIFSQHHISVLTVAATHLILEPGATLKSFDFPAQSKNAVLFSSVSHWTQWIFTLKCSSVQQSLFSDKLLPVCFWPNRSDHIFQNQIVVPLIPPMRNDSCDHYIRVIIRVWTVTVTVHTG